MKKILVLGIGGFSGRYFEAFFHNQCLGSCFTLVGADIDLSQALGTGSAAYRQIDATDQGQLHFLTISESIWASRTIYSNRFWHWD